MVLPGFLQDSESFALLASEMFTRGWGGGEFNEIISVALIISWDKKLCCSHISGSFKEICLRSYFFKMFLLATQQLLLGVNLGNILLEI